jgi:isoleucyl-tRNA synthetase
MSSPAKPATDARDYGDTILLPKTDFPRRAGLAQKEPQILARWEKMDIYRRQRDRAKGREKFVLHFGPPFANGHIHLGHLLSHTLKDFVTRSMELAGYDAPLVPGYDCHGLPIEWKIEEKHRAEKKNNSKETDPYGFRRECRDYAAHWSGVQTEELKRLGINGDWKNPYSTMYPESEAAIAGEIHKFLLNGSLYRGSKPVMWSPVEQTALAEAEVEYKDITSDTCFVKFPLKKGPQALLDAAAEVVIWTTTPWTLPGNRAIAYGEDLGYRAIRVLATMEESLVKIDDVLMVQDDLLESLVKAGGIREHDLVWQGKGADLAGAYAAHCLAARDKGYDFDVPLLPGDFVTTDAGTGFVHIAPGHGEDDYRLGLKFGVEVPHTVGPDGAYFPHVPLFAGAAVYMPDGKKGPANKFVMNALAEVGALVAKTQIVHSYPHSWRSKAPVIFRNTPQWFISMEKNDLRRKALAEIEKTAFYPPRGKNRIGSMVETRGDWCVSRQRAWGVPIAIFVDKKTGEPLADKAVLGRIIDIFKAEGSDSWYKRPAQDFLGEGYKADDYEQIVDIVDVWFESGSTHAFVMEARDELHWPADLYLEGSDQHRGWFQSSLLEAVGSRGRAPYKGVLTHGFILDEKGYKMSKSVGNGKSPVDLMQEYGADILRLWVAGSDYTEDIKFGENILKGHVDVYRRIRNTFCYLLGSFDGFSADMRVEAAEMSSLDRFMLHRLSELDETVRDAIKAYDYQRLISEVNSFCARDLSAFYFDICKDALYCEAMSSPKRRAIVTVLDDVFKCLVHWLAPILPFTCEEAWLSYNGLTFDDMETSIHLSSLPDVPAAWRDDALAAQWAGIIAARSVVTGALEPRRADKTIGASLEASPVVHVADTALAAALQSIDFADVCITSGIEVKAGAAPAGAFTLGEVPGVGVVFAKAEGAKCTRCWRYMPDHGSVTAHPDLCGRCAGVVG